MSEKSLELLSSNVQIEYNINLISKFFFSITGVGISDIRNFRCRRCSTRGNSQPRNQSQRGSVGGYSDQNYAIGESKSVKVISLFSSD